MTHIEIEVARYAGVCYGVERALGMAEKAADEARKPVNTLGPLIHNPLVVNDLESIGVGAASSVSEVEEGPLIIRAHGVVPSVVEDARARGLEVLDSTCPNVKKVQNAAERLGREGYQLIGVGESGHPEVEGIMGHAGDDAHVVSVPGDLDAIDLSRKVGGGLRSRGSRRHRSFAQGRRGRADHPDTRSAGRCRTAGASTPASHIERALVRMRSLLES